MRHHVTSYGTDTWSTWLSAGFRPFFLMTALHGALLAPAWAAVWAGLLPPPGWMSPLLWHAHEMLFGFVMGAVAGFLLTAVPNWTATPPVRGVRLAALACLWLAGRLAFACAAWLPALAVAVVDLAFLPTLGYALGRPLADRRQRHNHGFLGLLGVLFAANAAWHADALGLAPGVGRAVAAVSVYAVLVILVVVAGRIVPLFTARALVRWGEVSRVRTHAALDRASVVALVALLALQGAAIAGLTVPRWLAGGLPTLAALLVAARWLGWQGLAVRRDPLLWSLHLGFAWIPIGLALYAAHGFGCAVSAAAGLHALGVGAFGTMILAVMARVSLGHTGRELRAPAPMAWAYAGVSAAAASRVLGALYPALAFSSVMIVAGLFAASFATFAACYWPILRAPPLDAETR
jgi:uncharacterized protein involved in response to NO